MRSRSNNVWKSVDWITILLYLGMVIAGMLSIYGASYDFDSSRWFEGRIGSQMIWVGSAIVLTFIILMLDKDFFETFAYLFYGVIVLLLIITIFLAPDIKGSRSWLIIGPVHVQPAEFAKFATALALAKFMDNYNFNSFSFRNISVIVLLIITPMACILMEKETGSALVFLAFSLMLYREGMSGFILLASVCSVTFFVIVIRFGDQMLGASPIGELIVSILILLITTILIFLIRKDKATIRFVLILTGVALLAGLIVSFYKPVNFVWVINGLVGAIIMVLIFQSIKNLTWKYAVIGLFALLSIGFLFSINYVFEDMLESHQQMRIKVSLGLEDDIGGAGYNVNQSKIAIGSGGFFGKGFLNGTQTKLKYVPEQDTDFIYCTVGEEFGFIGSVIVLALFGILIVRLVYLAERQDYIFGRIYGYCVASVFFFHVLINIGMVLGITPVIGIPLPFFSYGGSSLWGFTILLFIFLRIDASRKER
ncbi:MAG: rod shape-determining protein RodA [Tannerella sp.]|jgi:rod shape determining protein RodA|nr:rod shape-determining protein RodA [Tannerella sp.]